MLGRARRFSTAHVGRFQSSKGFEIDRTFLGNSKRIVSFSLFGSDPKYFQNLEELHASYRFLFPSWGLRFYVARDVGSEVITRLRNMGHEVVVMAHTGRNGVNSGLGYFWRFLAAEDLSLQRVLVRDVDSLPLQRDCAMVAEWEASGKAFHIIRDHLYGGARVLAGIWGAIPSKDLVTRHIPSLWKIPARWGRDQVFLAKFLYPSFCESLLVHDIIHRYSDEEIVKSAVDLNSFEFIGEPSFPSEAREAVRSQFRELWNRFQQAGFEEPLPPDWGLRFRLRGEKLRGAKLVGALRAEGWRVSARTISEIVGEEND